MPFLKLAGLLLAISATCACGSALAQSADIDPGIIDAQTGDWLIAPETGGKGCFLRLLKEPSIGGYGIEGADSCTGDMARFADSAAWNFSDGGIILIDPLRKVLARFIENEGFPLRTEPSHGPVLDMVPATAGVDHLPAAPQIKGAWLMKRPSGETLCTIILDDKPDDNQNYAMTTGQDCVEAVRKLALTVWNPSGLGITLMGNEGSSLGFTATPGGFEKDREEGGKPLLLVRP